MWRGSKKECPPIETQSDSTCIQHVKTSRREDGALKTPDPMLAATKSISGWFPSTSVAPIKGLINIFILTVSFSFLHINDAYDPFIYSVP